MSDPVFTYDRINRWIEYQRVFSNLLTQSKTLDSQKYFPNQLNIKYLMEPNQFITAYSKLQNLISSNNSPVLIPLLGFDYPRSDTELLNIMYGQQERDFTRELVNSFNNFAFWVERIRLWEKILLDYSENEIFHLRHEFTKLPIDFCVSFPYLFKSRLTFCATKLCCIKAHTKE